MIERADVSHKGEGRDVVLRRVFAQGSHPVVQVVLDACGTEQEGSGVNADPHDW